MAKKSLLSKQMKKVFASFAEFNQLVAEVEREISLLKSGPEKTALKEQLKLVVAPYRSLKATPKSSMHAARNWKADAIQQKELAQKFDRAGRKSDADRCRRRAAKLERQGKQN